MIRRGCWNWSILTWSGRTWILSFAHPQPQVCHGRGELAWALGRQADQGVNSELEEISSSGDKMMVAVHTPGADQHRAWQGNDRNYLVLTLSEGQVVAMRAFRDLDEARSFTSADS